MTLTNCILICIIVCYIYHVAYIKSGLKYNIIIMDWSEIEKIKNYRKPAIQTDAFGLTVAQFLDQLFNHTGLKPADVHMIGHSLGAHVVGAVGAHIK